VGRIGGASSAFPPFLMCREANARPHGMCQRAPAFFMGSARRRFNGAAAEPLAGKRSAPAPAAKSSAPLKARVRRPRSFQF